MPAGDNRPLASIVVLDFGQVYQGPYATLLMAKAGADVILPPSADPNIPGLGRNLQHRFAHKTSFARCQAPASG